MMKTLKVMLLLLCTILMSPPRGKCGTTVQILDIHLYYREWKVYESFLDLPKLQQMKSHIDF